MQDRITQILQQMNEMQDEPVKMAIGGGTIGPGIGMPDFDPIRDAVSTQTNPDAGNAPFTQVYGQRRSSPLSMDEYLSGSMYDFAGIDVSATPAIDDDDKDDDDKDQAAPPNILTRVDERDDPSSVFRAVSQTTGQLGTGYGAANLDPSKYLEGLLNEETFTIKGDGFSKYAKQKFIDEGMVALAPAGLALGPIGLTALGAGEFAKRQNKKNAEMMMEYGGGAGDLFTLNGATVSRAPGERIFTGNLGGFSQEQLYAAREMDFGFIPGTMREVLTEDEKAKITSSRTGLGGVKAAGSVSGHIMDAFGTIHGVRDSDGGQMQVGAIAAQRMRENEFRSVMAAQGIDVNKQFTDGAGNFSRSAFTRAAVDYKQFVDGKMKTHPSHGGFFHKTSNLSPNAYASAMAFRDSVASRFVNDTYSSVTTAQVTGDPARKGPEPKRPPPPVDRELPDPVVTTRPTGFDDEDSERDVDRINAQIQRDIQRAAETAAAIREAQERDRDDDRDDNFYDPGPSDAYSGISGGFAGARATGGRVGMQAGGVAAEPAGFVEGPPENFTEKQTVADDRPMSVPEGTFVINAAAVEFAGSDDIKAMLVKAYSKLQKKLDKSPSRVKIPTEDEIDVAVSRGEVIVPPELAKIIGYDRLEKINNRGKKEVTRRQKKAGGGFLAGKKFASGGNVDYEDRIIADEVRRQMKEMIANLPDDVTFKSEYYEDQPVAKLYGTKYSGPTAKKIQEGLAAELGMVPITGRFRTDPRRKVVIAPQTPTLFNLFAMAEEIAHLDFPDKRRTNPYIDFGTVSSLFSPAATMQKKYREYNKKLGADEPFDAYDAFEREERYREEVRAKSIAYETVRGMLPKSKKTADFTLSGYQQGFAKYLFDNAPPVIREGMFKKYPELQKFVDDKGRFVALRTKELQEAADRFTAKQKRQPMQSGGMALPEPSPVRQKKAARQEAERMADVELRADLEEFIRDDQLARLGWNLYTSGELKVVGVPTPFDYTRVTKGEGEDARETVQDEMSYRYAGIYTPIPGRDTFPVFMGEGRTRVRASDNPKPEIREYLDKVGIKPSAEVPMAAYFAEPMYITKKGRTDPEVYMEDRAAVMLTLAHELRHAALNYLKFEYGAPEMTLSTEERVMDYFDQKGRKQASKNNALVLAESPRIVVAERGQSAVKLSMYKKRAELYNELATEVLKLRGVPPVAQPEEKGFISKFIDGLFRESPQSKLRKGDGKPVDYESEAMQSAQF